jgi:hypothetical protein
VRGSSRPEVVRHGSVTVGSQPWFLSPLRETCEAAGHLANGTCTPGAVLPLQRLGRAYKQHYPVMSRWKVLVRAWDPRCGSRKAALCCAGRLRVRGLVTMRDAARRLRGARRIWHNRSKPLHGVYVRSAAVAEPRCSTIPSKAINRRSSRSALVAARSRRRFTVGGELVMVLGCHGSLRLSSVTNRI